MRGLAVLFLAGGGILQAASVMTLDPAGGALVGFAGQTVGWGFTITNDANYLVVTGVSYSTTTPIGVFSDFIGAFNFIVVGPNPEVSPVSQVFNAGAHTGVGSYAISNLALPGALSTGSLHVIYDMYSVSPNDLSFNPDFDLLSSGNEFVAEASIQVAGTEEDVPEPSSWTLAAGALLAGIAKLRRTASRH